MPSNTTIVLLISSFIDCFDIDYKKSFEIFSELMPDLIPDLMPDLIRDLIPDLIPDLIDVLIDVSHLKSSRN